MQHIRINLHDTPETAPKYKPEEFTPVVIEDAVIVRNGTVGGNATIDFVMVDAEGKRYVALITAALVRNVVAATGQLI